MSAKTKAVLDEARETIARIETHIAKVRRASGHFDPDALQAQTLSKTTLDELELTLQHIEQTQEMIATSHARLKQIEARERYWTNQAHHRNKLMPPATPVPFRLFGLD